MNKDLLAGKIKEYRVPVLGLLATIVLGGIYFFRSGPAEDLGNYYTELNDEVQLLLSNKRNGADLSANLETIKGFTGLMEDRFISQNLADIHDIFYTLERESGVSLDSFQRPEMLLEPIKPKANEVEYQPLSMAITISGTFKNALKFIHSLENSPLLYRYNGLKISTKAQTTEVDLVSLTLNFELLSLNDE
ncbi:MAG: hypothetical protein O7C75_21930 [Verrucomicrobia bacterium]|nr:hypothetical protein [Verrucomicrobiota bacterium]